MSYDILRLRLKGARTAKGLSVGQLAKYAGVSRNYVYNLEKGERLRAGPDILERLAKVLETTPAYLLGQTNDPHEEAAGKLELPPDVADLAERLVALPLPVREVITRLLNTALDLRPLLSEADHTQLFGGLPAEERNRLESELAAQVDAQPPADLPLLARAHKRLVVHGLGGRTKRKRGGTGSQ